MACPQTLNGITTDCGSNIGGLSTTVYIANKDDVKSFTPDTPPQINDDGTETPKHETITTIEMESGKYFTPFSFRKNSANLTSDFTIDETNGVKFCTSNLVLKFAKQDSAKRLDIMALLYGNFVVVVEDMNKVKHILGYENEVTVTQSNSDTGTNSTDPNYYQITLTDISSRYPEIYSGKVEDLVAPAPTV